MANDLTPPDLQTAGAAQPPTDPQSLVGALRAGGSPPAGLMEALRPPQMTPGMMLAAAASQGLDPTRINPVQQQQNIQYQQQMEQVQMLQRQQNIQQEREFRKNEAAFSVLGKIVSDPNTTDATVKALMPQFQKAAKMYAGVDLPPSMATGALKPGDVDEIRKRIIAGYDEPTILAMYPRATPQDFQRIKTLPTDKRAMEYLGFKSDDAIKLEGLNIKIKEAELAEKQIPELKGDPKTTQRAIALHQQLFKQGFMEGTPETRGKAITQAILQQRQEHIEDVMKVERLKEQLALARQGGKPIAESTAVYVDKAGNVAPTNLTESQAAKAGYFKITPREFETVNQSQQAFTILQNLKTTVDRMKTEHLFVESEGLSGLLQEGTIAYKRRLGNPKVEKELLRNFESQKSQMVILLRQLGDKGVRALGAMAPAMDSLQPSAGAEAVESIMGNIESEIRALGVKSRTPDAYSTMPTLFPSPGIKGPLGIPAPPEGFKEVK